MKFTEEHEWLHAEGDIVIVGITEYAAAQLGDLVFVEQPGVGTEVCKDDGVVVIESVKAASDILPPLDGGTVAVNEALVDEMDTDPDADSARFPSSHHAPILTTFELSL